MMGRVVEAENARQKFVKESEIKFADEDFLGEEEEEEDESETNSESSFYSDYWNEIGCGSRAHTALPYFKTKLNG